MFDKNTRVLIIVGSIVTFVVVPLATVLFLSQANPEQTQAPESQQQAAKRTDEEINRAILDASPSLANDDGSPLFDLREVLNPSPRWYIAIVTSKGGESTATAVPNKVLLYDYEAQGTREGTLVVMAGPEVEFTEDEIELLGIPDVVAEELKK